MIINSQPLEAVSFTDGTTPNQKQLAPNQRRDIAIEATMPRNGSNLTWFYELLRRYDHVKGELKSNVIIQDFHTQPSWFQRQIWEGMRQVLIHITDVLPYLKEREKSASRILNEKWYIDAEMKSRSGDKASIEIVNLITNYFNDCIASSIQQSSSASRFIILMEILNDPYDLRRNPSHNAFPNFGAKKIDFSPAINIKKPNRTIPTLAKWAAKADSIFSTAEHEVFQGAHPSRFLRIENAFHAISQSYAFNHGDSPSISWMRAARETSVEAMYPHQYYYRKPLLRKLHEVDSKFSYFTQIADIAAKFADQTYQRFGLIEVAKRFEFVTFNGERVTENIATEKVRNWK